MKLTSNKVLNVWDWVRYLSILAAIIFTAVACLCSFSKPFEVDLDAKSAFEQQGKEQREKRVKEGKSRKSDKDIHADKPIPKKKEKRIA